METMRLAYSSNAYMRWSTSKAIDRIAMLGFEGIELMADVPHLWPPDVGDEQVAAVRRQLAERGLAISNINAFMMNAIQDFWHPSWIEPDSQLRGRRIQHTKDALRMARRLGAKCVTTEPGGPLAPGQSREQAMELFVTGLREALHEAEEQGVQLLVEPEPGLLIENSNQFMELSERIHSPMFGLNFDVGHFYCVGENLPATVQRMSPWTRHYHFEDIAPSRVHEHLIPGRGAIEFGEVIREIRETHYAGWLTVELYPYVDDPDGAGREARDFLTPLLRP